PRFPEAFGYPLPAVSPATSAIDFPDSRQTNPTAALRCLTLRASAVREGGLRVFVAPAPLRRYAPVPRCFAAPASVVRHSEPPRSATGCSGGAALPERLVVSLSYPIYPTRPRLTPAPG